MISEAEKTHNAMTRITGGIIGALGIESALKLEDEELERIALWVRESYETSFQDRVKNKRAMRS